MKNVLRLTQSHFESSSGRTPEYLSWHRKFKNAFKKFLTERGATDVQIGKPNHFDMSGFFTVKGQAWYFSISDIRWSKEKMLVRTAKDYKDYTGGRNLFVTLSPTDNHFEEEFAAVMNFSA
jgi:hypothetical protein